MTASGIQILFSSSKQKLIQQKTTIPQGYNQFQVNSICNVPLNLCYYLNKNYIEIKTDIKSTDSMKIMIQEQIYGGFKLTPMNDLPPIRIKMNTHINNNYVDNKTHQSYKFIPTKYVLKNSDINNFIDNQEQYFHQFDATNGGPFSFNQSDNEHTQKIGSYYNLSQNKGVDICSAAINYINLRLDCALYHYWIQDTQLAIAYRMMGLIKIYCPTADNYITSVEPLFTSIKLNTTLGNKLL